MNDTVQTQPPAKDRDAVIIEVGITEITLLIAQQLVAQGSITKEAFLNTTGATFGKVDYENKIIELILFGKENYDTASINIPDKA